MNFVQDPEDDATQLAGPEDCEAVQQDDKSMPEDPDYDVQTIEEFDDD